MKPKKDKTGKPIKKMTLLVTHVPNKNNTGFKVKKKFIEVKEETK